MNTIKKTLFIIFGTAAVALGIVGVFIPVLPTTPFLLLASFFYVRSSERLYHLLMNHPIFGSYIYCYLNFKAIPQKTKVGTIAFLWATLMVSMILVPSLHLRIFLILVGIAVTTHLLLLKTLSQEDLKKVENLYGNKRKTDAASEKE